MITAGLEKNEETTKITGWPEAIARPSYFDLRTIDESLTFLAKMFCSEAMVRITTSLSQFGGSV
jgi:hypothetical protein